jgi:arylsulfatase A-like enzyme
LNAPTFPESKSIMKPIRFNCFCRALATAMLWGATVFAGLSGTAAEPALATTNTVPGPPARRPNIILIVADGLGYGDLSCYGQTKFRTPNLDRLAAGGTRFTSYYAGNAASSPSRAALLLGREPGHLKQRGDADVPLAADEITVAGVLKSAGYNTGLIGEWNLGNDTTAGAPWRKGFDEFAGYLDPADAENYYADYIWRYAPRSFLNPTNNQLEDYIGREMLYPNTGDQKGQYIPDLYTKAALNFCTRYQSDRSKNPQPFFLLLTYKIPGSGSGVVPTDAPYSDEPWPQPAKNRAAMISRLDGYIGQLLEQVQKPGLSNNTVVFFTSDTGPQKPAGFDLKFFASAGPFRGGRGELYEGGLRVPMIAWWPGKIPSGRVSDLVWAAWDFLPTAADIARASAPTNSDGISVWPALSGQVQAKQHEFFHWQLRGRNIWHTVRLGDWEAVQPKADAPLELYNLKTDPGETNNVADKNPDVLRKFRDILKADH